jgi:hypothetical protein
MQTINQEYYTNEHKNYYVEGVQYEDIFLYSVAIGSY